MPRVLRVLRVLVLMVLTVPRVHAQQPAGAIGGQVIDGVSGRPMSAAVVRIDSAPGTPALPADPGLHGRAAILAGGDGRFLFPDLPPGSFFVYATKGGYAEGASGRRRPGGTAQAIELTPAARSADVVIRMWKYGAITGTVTDEAGEPVVGLTVRLLLRTRPGMPPAPTGPGFVSLQLPYANAGVPTLTDDRGIYRFANLADGDYLVIASPPLVSAARNTIGDAAQTGRGSADLFALMGASAAAVGGRGFAATSAPLEVGETIVSAGRGRAPVIPSGSGRIRVYPPTFYPAAIIPAQAATVTVTAGAERAGIDIALAPVPAARVTGMLLDRDGPVATTSLHLVPAGAEGMPQDVVAPTSVTDAAGTFVFTAVPAGQYRLRGSAPRGLATVDLPVAVGGEDVDGLTVTPTSPPKITATLQFDGTTSPPSGTGGRGPLTMPAFLLDAVDGASGADQLVEVVPGDRSYTLSGYSTGRYRVRVPNSPAGWMFKAALLNGVDVSETPFDLAKDVPDLTLVFTDRWTGVSGVVQGTGADAATVLAFPTDASQWAGDRLAPRRFKSARANARGQFGISSLPPGDYFIVAIPEEQAGDWSNPATLDALARAAISLTILDGEHKTLDLRVRDLRQ